jgi:hypothetical protein
LLLEALCVDLQPMDFAIPAPVQNVGQGDGGHSGFAQFQAFSDVPLGNARIACAQAGCRGFIKSDDAP